MAYNEAPSYPAITTPVSIANGGTNAGSFTQSNGIVVYNGTSLVNYAGPQLSSGGVATNSAQPCFNAVKVSNSASVTGDGTQYTIICDSVSAVGGFQQGGTNYSISTGTFTAPVTGQYMFNAQVFLTGLTSSFTSIILQLAQSGSVSLNHYLSQESPANILTSGDLGTQGSKIIHLVASDTINFMVTVSGATKSISVFGQNASPALTYFSGYLIC